MSSSFGYFKSKKQPNYSREARNSVLRSRERKKQQKHRRPSVLRSISHRNILDERIERQRNILNAQVQQKHHKLQTYIDHRIFPTLVSENHDSSLIHSVIHIGDRAKNLARSIARSDYPLLGSGSLGMPPPIAMPPPQLRLSRNELLQSALPEIDYLLRFKRAAFEKAHCPFPVEKYVPSKNRYDTGNAPQPYSTSASTDVESLRTKDQKHGRGWMAEPYQDCNVSCSVRPSNN